MQKIIQRKVTTIQIVCTEILWAEDEQDGSIEVKTVEKEPALETSVIPSIRQGKKSGPRTRKRIKEESSFSESATG